MRTYRTEKVRIRTASGSIKLLVLRPEFPREKQLPALLWIHGGGYSMGMASMVHISRARELASSGRAVVISPEYRLSGKSPYPAALEDCLAALVWIRDHAQELGAHPSKLMVGGESAGGGLAAAVCMAARDRGGPAIAFQFPLYPMLDHRDTPTSADNHGHVWNTRRNHRAWKKYLRTLPADQEVPVYASPALQSDFSGLPPCYTFVCEGEPFFWETLLYTDRLLSAGIPADVTIWPGKTHAFDMLMPWRWKSKMAADHFIRAFDQAARSCCAPQKSPENP